MQNFFLCEVKNSPNDIFESGNIILTFGKNNIEIFSFSQINNNNDINNNNNNQYKFEKKHEIIINNNNNLYNNIINNNVNDNNNNEISSIQLYKNFIVCGHISGNISIWEIMKTNEYLHKKGEIKIAQSSINKIYFQKIQEEKDHLYICCSDGIVEKFSFESSQVVLKSQKYETEIMDIKMINDFDKKNMLIISLKNGSLKVLDLNLNYLYEIPSRFKYNKIRYIARLKNPESIKDNTKGDLLLISEGNYLDIFNWIKPGSFKVNIHPNKEQNYMQQEKYNRSDSNVQMKFQNYI